MLVWSKDTKDKLKFLNTSLKHECFDQLQAIDF